MKKFLLFGIGLVLSSTVNAQYFTTQYGDTSKAAATGNGAEITNYITNTTAAPIKITWKVVATDMTGAWAADGVVGICDNFQCYTNDQNNTLLNGATYTSNDYMPNVTADFHMVLTGLNSVPAGTQYVTVSLNHGTQTDSVTFIVTKFPTGVTSVNRINDDIVVYPNPARDLVNVLFDAKANIKNITLYNLIGKAVRVYRVSGNSAKLDINDIPSGIYFLRLQDGQGRVVATRKLTHQ